MIIAACAVFGTSLILLFLLFVLKRAEIVRGARFGEVFRAQADRGALRIKSLLHVIEEGLAEVPFYLGAIARYLVHISALSFARLARASAQRAHQLADLVSHKHRFQRRETKSQFLREVSEVKNGRSNDDGGVATM